MSDFFFLHIYRCIIRDYRSFSIISQCGHECAMRVMAFWLFPLIFSYLQSPFWHITVAGRTKPWLGYRLKITAWFLLLWVSGHANLYLYYESCMRRPQRILGGTSLVVWTGYRFIPVWIWTQTSKLYQGQECSADQNPIQHWLHCHFQLDVYAADSLC